MHKFILTDMMKRSLGIVYIRRNAVCRIEIPICPEGYKDGHCCCSIAEPASCGKFPDRCMPLRSFIHYPGSKCIKITCRNLVTIGRYLILQLLFSDTAENSRFTFFKIFLRSVKSRIRDQTFKMLFSYTTPYPIL